MKESAIGRSVSLSRAAQLLGCSRRTIYNYVRRGTLKTKRTLGGSQRVLVSDLQADPRYREIDGRE